MKTAKTTKIHPLYKENIPALLPQFHLKDYNKLSVATNQEIRIIDMDHIIYCKSSGNYCEIYLTNDTKVFISKTLKSVEEKLNLQFLRIHNSYVVNLLSVVSIDTSKNQLITHNQSILPISRSRKQAVIKSLL